MHNIMVEIDTIYEGRFYKRSNGTQLNFGKDCDLPFNHREEIVAKWDVEKERCIIARKKDVMKFNGSGE